MVNEAGLKNDGECNLEKSHEIREMPTKEGGIRADATF